MRLIPLSDIKKNEKFMMEKIETAGEIRRRLLDLGFVEGTRIKCLRVSPFGDPKAYLVRGAVIALRKEDAQTIMGVKI